MLKYSTAQDAAVKSESDNVTGQHLGSVMSFYLLHKQDTKSKSSHLDSFDKKPAVPGRGCYIAQASLSTKT